MEISNIPIDLRIKKSSAAEMIRERIGKSLTVDYFFSKTSLELGEGSTSFKVLFLEGTMEKEGIIELLTEDSWIMWLIGKLKFIRK